MNELVLLALLHARDRDTSGVAEDCAALKQLGFEIGVGAVASALESLEARSLVRSEASFDGLRARRVYTLTTPGRREFVELMRNPAEEARLADWYLRIHLLGWLAPSERREVIGELRFMLENALVILDDERGRFDAEALSRPQPVSRRDIPRYQQASTALLRDTYDRLRSALEAWELE